MILPLLIFEVAVIVIYAITMSALARGNKVRAKLPAEPAWKQEEVKRQATEEGIDFLESLAMVLRRTIVLLAFLLVVAVIFEVVLPVLT